MAANIDALNANTHLNSITPTDAGTPTLTLTTAQLSADTFALSKISNANYIISAPGTQIAFGSGDTLVGGAGLTTLVSNAASNALQAGTGQTIASYAASNLTVDLSIGKAQVSGASAYDTLLGITNVQVSGNNDILVAGSGTDSLADGGASGIYRFSQNAGVATIINGASSNATASNELDLGTRIADNRLWFTQSANDLVIDVMGSTKHVTVSGWFASDGNKLQEIVAGGLKIDNQVSQLVQAMATYSANHAGFDPTAVSQVPSDSALQATIGLAWHA